MMAVRKMWGRKTSGSGPIGLRSLLALYLVFGPFPFSLSPFPLAWGAHPFITDDSGTQGAGGWQLELLVQRDHHVHAAATAAVPVQQRGRSLLFNSVLTYGLLENLDVAVGLNYLSHRDSRVAAGATDGASGATDSTLELKWRFLEKNGFSMALKPALSLPSGDEKRGLGSGRTFWGANLIAGYEAGPWTWLGNVSYFHRRYGLAQDAAGNRAQLWRVSTGAAYAPRAGVKLVGELGVRTNEARGDPFLPGRHARFAMLGVVCSPSKTIDLDVGLRKGLNAAENDTVLLLGAAFRW
jgi:Putative MetA-pathway of phenol degradation